MVDLVRGAPRGLAHVVHAGIAAGSLRVLLAVHWREEESGEQVSQPLGTQTTINGASLIGRRLTGARVVSNCILVER